MSTKWKMLEGMDAVNKLIESLLEHDKVVGAGYAMLDDDVDLNKFVDDLFLSINEELKEKQNPKSSLEERLKKASEIMNKNIENAIAKVNKKERQILVDSPIKTDKCSCGDKCDCNKCATESSNEVKTETSKSTLDVKNAFTADSLNSTEVKEPTVRLINVKKTAVKALERIYDRIKEASNLGCYQFDFLASGWDDLLEGVRASTIEKVISRVADHLIENGFDVSTCIAYDNEGISEMSMNVSW